MGLGKMRKHTSDTAPQAPYGKSEETNTSKRNPRLGRWGLLCWEHRQETRPLTVRGNWTPAPCSQAVASQPPLCLVLASVSWLHSLGKTHTCDFICIAGYAYIPSHRPQGSTELKRSSQPLARLGTPSFPSCPGDMSQPSPRVWLCVPMQLGGSCGDHGWPPPCLATLLLLNSYR